MKVAEKNGTLMFMSPPELKFLDVMNYLAPGTSYAKWVKTYGTKLQKSWFPYEWLPSAKTLEHRGLDPYWEKYSKHQGSPVLSLGKYFCCVRNFKEEGLKTMVDWLRCYNNLDVGPFLRALEEMQEFL